MKNRFTVVASNSKFFETYELAEANAKKCQNNMQFHNSDVEYVIVEAIAKTVSPVPSVEVVKIEKEVAA